MAMNLDVTGIWIIDADAKTAYANERMAEILGTSPPEMVSLSFKAGYFCASHVGAIPEAWTSVAHSK
jgi:PAS domain-containing protein